MRSGLAAFAFAAFAFASAENTSLLEGLRLHLQRLLINCRVKKKIYLKTWEMQNYSNRVAALKIGNTTHRTVETFVSCLCPTHSIETNFPSFSIFHPGTFFPSPFRNGWTDLSSLLRGVSGHQINSEEASSPHFCARGPFKSM